MRILVTGASGYIGGWLCDRLVANGDEVIRVTRRPSPTHPSAIPVEINGDTNWDRVLDDVQLVVHLAARVHNKRHPSGGRNHGFEADTAGTITLARECARAGVSQFVFLSSLAAMATTSVTVLTEASVCVPDTEYGRGKLATERALTELSQESGIGVTVVRPPIVYGPGAPGNMARLISLLATPYPIPLGHATGLRSMISIQNLVDALTFLIHSPDRSARLLLVSDDDDVSTASLARDIRLLLGRKPRLPKVPRGLVKAAAGAAGLGDEYRRLFGALQVDISKIKELGWAPPIPRQVGLKLAVSDITS